MATGETVKSVAIPTEGTAETKTNLPLLSGEVVTQKTTEDTALIDLQHIEMLRKWTAFGHFLVDHGLIVYQNAIDHEQDWRWSWCEGARAGYADRHDAMIAALRYHILYGEPLKSTHLGRLWIRVLFETFSCLVSLGRRLGKWFLS